MRRPDRAIGAFDSLKWADAPTIATTFALAETSTAGLSTLSQMANGITFPPEVDTPKKRAIWLLWAAAEVEHQFIIQYLYAFYCGGSTSPALTLAERRFLMIIATEEMGHLLTVQNLLAMLGEPPYLERRKRLPSDLDPTPFRLSPIQIGFVVRFLIAENGPKFETTPEMKEILEADGATLEQIHRVGIIYAMVYWLFQDGSGAMGDWTIPLGMDMPDFQALGHLSDDDFVDVDTVKANLSVAEDWEAKSAPSGTGRNILVMPAKDVFSNTAELRNAALSAIHAVAGQGEGPVAPMGGEPSHADRLQTIFNKLIANPQPVSPFPTDPYLEDTPGAPPENHITFGDAVDKAREVDRLYEKLLLNIALSALPGSIDRTTPAVEAIDLMRSLLGPAAEDLIKLQRQEGGAPAQKAGPPFTFPAQGIPTDEATILARLAALGA